MNKILLVIILITIITSCSNKIIDPVLSDFTEVINLKGTTSQIESSKLGEVVDMIIIDTVLVINEMFNDYIFKLFDIKSGKLICNCIRKGKGSNEMISPRLITSYNKDIFTTYEGNKKELIYISINDLLSKDFKFYKSDKIELSGAFTLFPINDSMMISTGAFEKGRYCLYNKNLGKGVIKFDYPYDEKHKNEILVVKGFAFQGEISIKPDLTKFTMACSTSGNIEIYRLSGNDFERVFKKVYSLPQYENINNHGVGFSKKNKIAFISLFSSDKYIYTIYSGGSMEESGQEYYHGNNLLVYNWEGQPILNL